MVLQYLASLGSMPLVLVISTVQILISSCQVTPYFAQPSKVWLMFDSFQNLVHEFLKCHIDHPSPSTRFLDFQIPFGPQLEPRCRDSFEYCNVTSALPLLCCRSSSNILYSSIRLISFLMSSGGLFVNDSRNSESSSKHNLKVLAAIFSLPPSISLYNS